MSKTIPTALTSWSALNGALKELSEDECWKLLEKEKKDRRRVQFMLRIHSRANKLRAERERRSLTSE